MPLPSRPFTAFACPVLFVALTFCGAAFSSAQDSDFNLGLHANSHATAAQAGLPAYPGATLYKDPGHDSSVDMGFNVGESSFKLVAVTYVTGDTPARVFAFYRKSLAHYGDVLECDHGKPVGAMTATRAGLTCSSQTGDPVQVKSHANSSSDHELRAGAPNRFRIVAINESQTGPTRFGLVYVEVPRDNEAK